ncbi:MAG: hypothetical protein IPJ40_09840 [Saprospirales bacterium]|nr:hypothetical protein [Saprospirales bacterium]
MITYFLSLMVCWAACLALYAGLLRKEKFFHLNRAYLLLTLVLGLLIPAVDWFPASTTPVEGLIQQVRWLPEVTVTNTPVLQSTPLTAWISDNYCLGFTCWGVVG